MRLRKKDLFYVELRKFANEMDIELELSERIFSFRNYSKEEVNMAESILKKISTLQTVYKKLYKPNLTKVVEYENEVSGWFKFLEDLENESDTNRT